MDISNKRLRRNISTKTEKAPNPSKVLQNTKKTSAPIKKTKSSKLRKDNGSLLQSNSNTSAPSISELASDCLSTFQPVTRNSKKHLNSASVAIKRKSKVAGIQTPLPRKVTLKRQSGLLNALKEKNEGHEDDIFENQKFQTPIFRISNQADDESNSSMRTPKFDFLLTPTLPKKSPTKKATKKEAIASSELLLARKNAQEYLYKRNKKRTSDPSMLTSPSRSQTSTTCDEEPEKKRSLQE